VILFQHDTVLEEAFRTQPLLNESFSQPETPLRSLIVYTGDGFA
jgi:hypothetical protein